MKKILIAAALVAGGSLCLQDITSGHGGTYRGPGDTVPPGGGGGPSGPGTPGAGGPTTPGPAGPTGPGPTTPGGPAGGPSGGPAGGPTTGGGDSGPDLTMWQFWWGFNKEPYLNLKSAIHSGSILTGSDDFYLGRGEQTQAKDSLKPSEAVIREKVVPALIEALNNERSNDIVTGCLVALAKIGDVKGEDGSPSKMAVEIKKKLGDGSQEIAETAAVSLGILANEANIGLLGGMLESNSTVLKAENVPIVGAVNERSRAFAGYGLGLIGAKCSDEGRKAIVDILVRMLDGEGRRMQRDVPVACVTSLGLTPLPLDPAMEPVELKKAPKIEKVATRQDQLIWLVGFYNDEQINFMVRAHAPIAMARLLSDLPGDHWLRAAVAARLIEDTTRHSKVQQEIRQSVVIALGQIADCDDDATDKAIRSALMKIQDETADQQSRYFAMIALGQAGSRPGNGSGDPLAGLADKKENVREYLMLQASKGKGQTKPWAALALGVLERGLRDNKMPVSPAAVELLRKELDGARTPSEVGAFALAVGLVGDQSARDVLLEKLEKIGDPDARGYCAVGLGLMNASNVIEPITAILKKSAYQPELLKSAAIGLGLLGDKVIVDDLIQMLADAKALSSQAAISSALGFIGDARSIDPLIALLKDKEKTDRARGFAAAALGIVADKEVLPWNAKISVNINYRANTPTLTTPEGLGILDIL